MMQAQSSQETTWRSSTHIRISCTNWSSTRSIWDAAMGELLHALIRFRGVREQRALVATQHEREQGHMKPGDYPLRSTQSRAAARHVSATRRAAQGEGTLIRLRFIGSPFNPDQKCTCPPPPTGTVAICRCFCSLEPCALNDGNGYCETR